MIFESEITMRKRDPRNTHGLAWFGLGALGLAAFAVVWGWELTYLSRLSQDDGTFGRSKLPQIMIPMRRAFGPGRLRQ